VSQAPGGFTTMTWDYENRMTLIAMPDGTLNTMAYRYDNLRYQLWDSEGNKRMVWDEEGTSGYKDVLEENTP